MAGPGRRAMDGAYKLISYPVNNFLEGV